jgi:peptidoglycan/xylan/chitin deacetylase (PgdA/CDA1 family)
MKAIDVNHRQPIAILAYHSIDDSGSVLSTPAAVFAEQMRILAELDVDIVNMNQISRRINQTSASKPMVAITFDDGFRNIYEHGLPVLQSCGFTATVYLVTDYCGKANSWPSQPPGIMSQRLLGWNEVKEMSQAEILFGSHTRTHPDLTALSPHEAEQELIGSKNAIEDAIGCSVETFAYPYGAYNGAVKRLTKKHFKNACSTALGFVHAGSDIFALERLDMYYLRSALLFQHLFSHKVQAYVGLRRIARTLRSIINATPELP